MTYQPWESINPLKDALVALISDHRAALGIKTVKKDIVPTDILAQVELLTPVFPAVIVVYSGRQAQVRGLRLETHPLFSLVVADRVVSGPNEAVSPTMVLLDGLMNLIHGATLLPKIQQQYFEFAGDELFYQDMTKCIYRLHFATQVNWNTRQPGKVAPNSP